MRVFLMPLGFHEDILLRAMTRLRVHREDLVYVVTCSPLVGAVKRALESLRALCLKQGFPEPILLEVECRDFYESVRRVKSTISQHGDAELVLCSGSGLRILLHILEVAVLASRRPFTLHYEPEAEGVDPVTIPSTLYASILESPSRLEEEVLRVLVENKEISVKDLALKLRVKEKTVRNVITRLKNRGLVVKTGKGKVSATQVALVLYA